MNRVPAVLLVVVGIEVMIGIWCLFGRTPQTVVPQPDLSGYPAITQRLVTEAVNDTRADVPNDWHQLADTLLAAGFYSEAEACYRQAVRMAPDRTPWRYSWAFCLSSLGDLQNADEQYRNCIDLGHDDVDACYWFIGKNALRDGRIEDARLAFEESPELDASQLELAELEIREGKTDAAGRLLNELILRYPNAWRIHRLLAEASGTTDPAKSASHEALADVLHGTVNDPWQIQASKIQQLTLGLGVQKQVGDMLRALTQSASPHRIRAAVQRDNEQIWDALLEDLLARIDFADHDFEAQRIRLERIIDLDGADAYRSARLGEAHLFQNRFKEAEAVLRTGIRLTNGNDRQNVAEMCRMLAQILHESDRHEDAELLEARAEFVNGSELMDRTDVSGAVDAFQRAVDLDDTSPVYWYWLGRSRQLLGQAERAITAFENCLEIDPYHERAGLYRDVLKSAAAKSSL